MNTPNHDVLTALGIADLSPEEQEEVLADLGSLISQGTLTRLIERMGDGARTRFMALLETDPSEEQVQAFLREQVGNPEEAAREALAEITGDILGSTQA